MRFVRARLEAALDDPAARLHLVWPTVLGAPRLREEWPEGVPLEVLLGQAGRMLAALGCPDPERAWLEALEALPDTADRGPGGWLPHRIWEPLAATVSLRCGVILLALTGQPEGTRYRLGSAVTLFNSALFHECHDALEPLWLHAEGDLKRHLQGLILMTAGFFHQQHHDVNGMLALWPEALELLESAEGRLDTPWGRVTLLHSLEAVEARLAKLEDGDPEQGLEALWSLSRPEWGFLP